MTSTGLSKRRLYTDDEDVIYRFRRCVGINGINIAATKPDLLERALILHLKRMGLMLLVLLNYLLFLEMH